MIAKFLRRRNASTSNDFNKQFARIQVHANGSQTFNFKKVLVASNAGFIINTELGIRLNTELSQRLIVD